jgi:hypothetical protein
MGDRHCARGRERPKNAVAENYWLSQFMALLGCAKSLGQFSGDLRYSPAKFGLHCEGSDELIRGTIPWK